METMNTKGLFKALALGSLLLSATVLPARAQTPPAPASAGPVDPALIEDLVAGSWILADQGVLDAFGHISVRHPKNPNRFLMSRSLAPALVTANDIMEFDLDANPVDPQGRALFLERFIHAQIYKARPDVMAIVHSHSPAVIPFGVTQTPLKALYHNSAFLAAGVPVFDIRKSAGMTDMLIRNNDLGKALAETLADKLVVLMRGHGDVAVGPSIPVAVFRAVYTEVNARLQTQAAALGGPINALEPEEGVKADQTNQQVTGRPWQLWKQKAMAGVQ
jgi:ribulose-5-phosphate 4-epimerase/fuculose-1-phosphate aldolase